MSSTTFLSCTHYLSPLKVLQALWHDGTAKSGVGKAQLKENRYGKEH
jgi:hypothetical protein